MKAFLTLISTLMTQIVHETQFMIAIKLLAVVNGLKLSTFRRENSTYTPKLTLLRLIKLISQEKWIFQNEFVCADDVFGVIELKIYYKLSQNLS